MFRRYEIPTKDAPPAAHVPNKFRPEVSRWRLAAMLAREALRYRFEREVLLSRPCIYGVFSGPVGGFWPIRRKCVGCMRCVQEYPEMCRVDIEPAWRRLGDSYFDPESLLQLEFEAATGEIPVKGVGYKGPFSGPGFDSMWTDMSEIVRPTRDGIYGREHISTAVDIGRKPRRLPAEGILKGGTAQFPIVEAPLPLIFDELPSSLSHPTVDDSIRRAATRLGSFYLSRDIPQPPEFIPFWAPLLERKTLREHVRVTRDVKCLEYEPGEGEDDSALRELVAGFPRAVVAARLPLNSRTPARVLELFKAGIGTFHLAADYHGLERGEGSPRFVKDSLLALHRRLVQEGLRDEVTLIASGGIVRAEHVPKAVICGADLVALDTPLLAALHAVFSGECRTGDEGALRARRVDPAWGAQRIVNVCAAWRNQLLEIVSAMGIRDIRRLRGETGRAMFHEELEAEWLR